MNLLRMTRRKIQRGMLVEPDLVPLSLAVKKRLPIPLSPFMPPEVALRMC